MYRNKTSFYGYELPAPRPTLKLEDCPFLAVRDRLFNIFAATQHIRALSSLHNLRTRHAVVTWTQLTRTIKAYCTALQYLLRVLHKGFWGEY
jgi:NAD-dependent DNA ligase